MWNTEPYKPVQSTRTFHVEHGSTILYPVDNVESTLYNSTMDRHKTKPIILRPTQAEQQALDRLRVQLNLSTDLAVLKHLLKHVDSTTLNMEQPSEYKSTKAVARVDEPLTEAEVKRIGDEIMRNPTGYMTESFLRNKPGHR